MLYRRKDRTLSQEAFDKLLACLDNDREKAGKKYETIRGKLVKFFEWRGCSLAEDYADRTIDRVAARLLEGVEISPVKPYLYFHGVALNLLKEYWREPQKELPSSQSMDQKSSPPKEGSQNERLQDCMDRCLQSLPPETCYLLFQYHQAEGKNKERRRNLAKTIRVPLNALRIRVYRIRLQLEDCVKKCLQQTEK
ncbi:hypothetical protein L0222_16210 [bacterium]|nr:hypothetical protein [bacterium]MCI0603893.1 hypothetical protein [bacterium]